jgi:hypothetical protein
VRIVLRGSADDLKIVIAPARPLPLDWERWRDALLGGAPAAPIVEEFTEPEGWSVTIVAVGARMHAFYAVLDHAVHAVADAAPEQHARLRTLFRAAAPIWDDEIVALGDL